MKIEKRGKYAGVKVHLDEAECQAILDHDPGLAHPQFPVLVKINTYTVSMHFHGTLRKKIIRLIAEEPDLLKDRTPEEVQHELEVEFESARQKLAAIQKGADWKEIHIK